MTGAKTSWSVGIIGCGQAGAYHAAAFAAQKDFVVAGCASRRVETAQTFGARFGARPYPSGPALLADDAIDVIAIVTPESVRLELLDEALGRHRDVFVEKPLYAANGQEQVTEDDYLAARDVLKTWDRDCSCFGVNYNYRTMPHLRRLKADVETGRLGRVKVARAWAHFACWSHVIDQLRWALGEVEKRVGATKSPVIGPCSYAPLRRRLHRYVVRDEWEVRSAGLIEDRAPRDASTGERGRCAWHLPT